MLADVAAHRGPEGLSPFRSSLRLLFYRMYLYPPKGLEARTIGLFCPADHCLYYIMPEPVFLLSGYALKKRNDAGLIYPSGQFICIGEIPIGIFFFYIYAGKATVTDERIISRAIRKYSLYMSSFMRARTVCIKCSVVPLPAKFHCMIPPGFKAL